MRKILIVFLIWLPSLVSAGPNKVSSFLINEPVTLMDLGILRLELFLADFSVSHISRIPTDLETVVEMDAWVAKNKLGVSINISYDPQDDTLDVVARPTIPAKFWSGSKSQPMPPVSISEKIEWCKWTLEDLRSKLSGSDIYGVFFSHYGYIRSGNRQPKNIGENGGEHETVRSVVRREDRE